MFLRRVTAGALLATLCATPGLAESYWLPQIQRAATETTYTFNVRLPDSVGQKVAAMGERLSPTIDGQPRTVVRQRVNWDDNSGNAKLEAGMINIMGTGMTWVTEDQLKEPALVAAIRAAILETAGSVDWPQAELMVLVSDGDTPPNVSWHDPISPVEQAKAKLRELAKTTRPGTYYPDTQVPVDMDTFIRMVMFIGNNARRDPDYRRKAGKQYAIDLSGATATQKDGGPQKIYKDNLAPPYFDDLVVSKELSETCQFQAEYQAHTLQGGHDGPTSYTGAGITNQSMLNPSDRARQIIGRQPDGYLLEGAGGGGPADEFPEGWLHTETHYRPWFNIDARTVAMGFGIAQGSDGGWYGCKLALGRKDDDRSEVAKMTLLDIPAEINPDAAPALDPKPADPAPKQQALLGGTTTSTPAPDPQQPALGSGTDTALAGGATDKDVHREAATDRVSEIKTGEWLKKGQRYLSHDGKLYLAHQDDNNLVIKRTEDDGFLWGLNEQPDVDYRNADKVGLSADGRLVVYDKDMNEIWVRLDDRPGPINQMTLYPDGNLMMGAKAVPFNIEAGSLIPFKRLVLSPGTDLAVGDRFYGYGQHYATLQGDGNFVVYTLTTPPQYMWGLNEVPGVNFAAVKLIRYTEDGRLVALDANGAEVWGVPETGTGPEGLARLNEQGVLQVLHPSTGESGVDRAAAWSAR